MASLLEQSGGTQAALIFLADAAGKDRANSQLLLPFFVIQMTSLTSSVCVPATLTCLFVLQPQNTSNRFSSSS
eukprot:1105463-Pleurochrysis_carterae.AAC.1